LTGCTHAGDPHAGWTPPSYDHVVKTYGLEILMVPGDLSIENGDLAITKDGDLKMGDTIYNGLFRLVQAWRYNAPHLRFLFEMMSSMQVRKAGLDEKMNRIGEERHARFDIKTYMQPDPVFIEAFHTVRGSGYRRIRIRDLQRLSCYASQRLAPPLQR
jgi:hypothetical protein